MTHTYEELKHKTVTELRDIAKDLQHEAVQGYTQMNKDHLLPAICTALGLESHEHHAAALAGKTAIKARMRKLKAESNQAIADANHDELHLLRREYHHLNHRLRVAARKAVAS